MRFRTLVTFTEEHATYLEERATREEKDESVIFNEIVRAYLENPTMPPKKLPPRPKRKFFLLDVKMAKQLNELCKDFGNKTRPDLVHMAVEQAMNAEEGG